MRIYPPVPAMLPRLVPEGDAMIKGQYVPEGTSIFISIYSTVRSATNFAEPDTFIPECWLSPSNGSITFVKDSKFALQPFSYGPRVCIGQHLAFAEMRLILVKLLWHFDLELSPEEFGWSRSRILCGIESPLEVNVSLAPNTV